MADAAVNVVTLLPASEELVAHRKTRGKRLSPLAIDHALEEMRIELRLALCDSPGNVVALRATVGEQRVLPLRLELRLEVHVEEDVYSSLGIGCCANTRDDHRRNCEGKRSERTRKEHPAWGERNHGSVLHHLDRNRSEGLEELLCLLGQKLGVARFDHDEEAIV